MDYVYVWTFCCSWHFYYCSCNCLLQLVYEHCYWLLGLDHVSDGNGLGIFVFFCQNESLCRDDSSKAIVSVLPQNCNGMIIFGYNQTYAIGTRCFSNPYLPLHTIRYGFVFQKTFLNLHEIAYLLFSAPNLYVQ